jgi:hypothetical protein
MVTNADMAKGTRPTILIFPWAEQNTIRQTTVISHKTAKMITPVPIVTLEAIFVLGFVNNKTSAYFSLVDYSIQSK